MSNIVWQFLIGSVSWGIGIADSAIAVTAPSVTELEVGQESMRLAQVASVNELSDVSPEDWADTALQNLVEHYQCVEGYPDHTFQEGQPMTRYEFAVALNSCWDNLLYGGPPGNDLATIQRLASR